MKTTVRQLLIHGLVRPRLMRTAQRDSTLAGEQAVDLWTMRFAHRGACRGQLFELTTAHPFAHKLHSLPLFLISKPLRIEDTKIQDTRLDRACHDLNRLLDEPGPERGICTANIFPGIATQAALEPVFPMRSSVIATRAWSWDRA